MARGSNTPGVAGRRVLCWRLRVEPGPIPNRLNGRIIGEVHAMSCRLSADFKANPRSIGSCGSFAEAMACGHFGSMVLVRQSGKAHSQSRLAVAGIFPCFFSHPHPNLYITFLAFAFPSHPAKTLLRPFEPPRGPVRPVRMSFLQINGISRRDFAAQR